MHKLENPRLEKLTLEVNYTSILHGFMEIKSLKTLIVLESRGLHHCDGHDKSVRNKYMLEQFIEQQARVTTLRLEGVYKWWDRGVFTKETIICLPSELINLTIERNLVQPEFFIAKQSSGRNLTIINGEISYRLLLSILYITSLTLEGMQYQMYFKMLIL